MRKTLFLFLIAVGLAAYVYFYEIEGGKAREKEKEQSEKIFHFDKDSVSSLSITGRDENFEFVKTEDDWKIVQPVQTDADESPLNSLISSMVNLKKERTLKVDAGELADYGLAERARKVEVKTASGETDYLYIGDDTKIGSNVYANQVDTTVYLVPSTIKRNAGKSLFEWRNKKAINTDKDKIREFILKNKYGSFTFVKEGSDWMMTSPVRTKTDQAVVTAILNKLDFGRIKSVKDEGSSNPGKYGLTQPETRIELFLGPEKAQQALSFSRLKDNEAYGKDDTRPHIYTVDSTFLQPFSKKLFDFRKKEIVEFEDSGVDRINLLFEDTLMTFNKDSSDNWILSSGEKARNWKINNIIRDLKNLKAKRFVEENPTYLMPYGLTNPRGRVEIFSGNDKRAELDVGKDSKDRVYVRNPRVGSVVEIDKSDLEKIIPVKNDLLEPIEATDN